jgi:hypothetical protein
MAGQISQVTPKIAVKIATLPENSPERALAEKLDKSLHVPHGKDQFAKGNGMLEWMELSHYQPAAGETQAYVNLGGELRERETCTIGEGFELGGRKGNVVVCPSDEGVTVGVRIEI